MPRCRGWGHRGGSDSKPGEGRRQAGTLAIRITPIQREVRRLSRSLTEEQARRDYLRWATLVAVFVATVFLTAPFFLHGPPKPDVGGRVFQAPVRAAVAFRHTPEEKQREWEAFRERNHRRIWTFNTNTRTEVLVSLNEFFQACMVLDPRTLTREDLSEFFRRQNPRMNLPETDLAQALMWVRDVRFQEALRNTFRTAYDEYLVVRNPVAFKGHVADGVISLENLPKARRSDMAANVLPWPPDRFEWQLLIRHRLADQYGVEGGAPLQEALAFQVISSWMQPSVVMNEEATRLARERFPKGDLSRRFERGDVILSADVLGRQLRPEEIAVLASHQRQVEHRNHQRLAGHVAFVLLVFLIISFYVRKFSRQFQFTTYNVTRLALPVLLSLLVSGFCLLLADGDFDPVGYLFPAGALGMLGVLLLDVRLALLLVTWGCLLFGLQVDLSYEYVLVALFGGYTAVAALYTIRTRFEVFFASLLVGTANSAVILITSFIQNPESFSAEMNPTLQVVPLFDTLTRAGFGMTSGILSFLVIAILPVFERFGIVTDMQLLELTGLHNPLLQRLEEKAPGTWQHTLNVTKLAEAAAREVGVNYLLIRAGCYYHDIGKTAKPEYFTENQVTPEDKQRHSKLKPSISTLVIMNHVKEGVEMAREAGLPERIIDFIRQHHGTSAINYFYHKALEAQARGETKDPVRIEDFRYPGPKPQTIEAGIVMLADTVEATATAKLSGRTVREDEIQQLVRTTVFEKFNDGQFDECNLTLRDLNVIRETFVEVLRSRFHTRIDYPKKPTGPAPRVS